MSKPPEISKRLPRKRIKPLSDQEIIRLFKKTGKEDYFRALYRRYSSKVYSKCISMLEDEVFAADATQEIFLKVYLKLSTFEAKSRFSTWLYSITFNYCIDFLRKQKKTRALFTEEQDERVAGVREEVPDQYLLEMQVDRLKEVLNHIPSGDRAILLMKYYEEISIKEITEIVQKSESAVKMQLKRAKEKVRVAYEELFGLRFSEHS